MSDVAPDDLAAPRRLVVEADGGSRGNPGPAGFGALVRDASSGRVLAERGGFLGTTTNNVAEYSGLVAGLRAAAEIDPDARVTVRMDSRLVVEQMSGRWQIKHADMARLAAEAAAVLPAGRVTYEWVPRAQNVAADRIANEAMHTGGTIARDHGPDGDGSETFAPSATDVDRSFSRRQAPRASMRARQPAINSSTGCNARASRMVAAIITPADAFI